MQYIIGRLKERSTWLDIMGAAAAGVATAAGMPWKLGLAFMALSIGKALIADGPVKK